MVKIKGMQKLKKKFHIKAGLGEQLLLCYILFSQFNSGWCMMKEPTLIEA